MSKTATVGYLHEEPLSFEYPKTDNCGFDLPALDVALVDPNATISSKLLRDDDLENLPTLSEFDTIRHFTRLSKLNVSIDSSMYPLGSCTMKYNPRINEDIARYKGFAHSHPMMPTSLVQGSLEVLYTLENLLKEIGGFEAVSLQPAAGAQGELTGILIIKECLANKGENRKYILIPDSAHGTNPSSAALAGYEVKDIKSLNNGLIDLNSLEENMDETVAGIMLTNPNTLGIFETSIEKICEIVHKKGGYVYLDGANFNAHAGIVKPGLSGIDVMHLNLHKTFSTPHGGGGPGAGPCLCSKELGEYLPVPRIVKNGDIYDLDSYNPKSVGKLNAFFGNFGILLRAKVYIETLGAEGVKLMSQIAVLNANYLKHQLASVLELETKEPVMHEAVFNETTLTAVGISTLDLAKRLMDYGFHPPTIYFPLIVKGALMIEPSESEPKAELDRLCEAIKMIMEEAKTNPDLVKNSPYSTPRGRLDETKAARNPVLRWQK